MTIPSIATIYTSYGDSTPLNFTTTEIDRKYLRCEVVFLLFSESFSGTSHLSLFCYSEVASLRYCFRRNHKFYE